MKIQICSERANSRLSYLISTTFAIFIGFFMVFYTLLYEHVLPLTAFGVGVIWLSAGTVYEVHRIRGSYGKQLKRISEMIETVKNGRELPKLEELLK